MTVRPRIPQVAGEAAAVEALLAAGAERAEQAAREIAGLQQVEADGGSAAACTEQVEALRSRRGGVFARTEGGHPPLAFAAAGGDAATARLLLEAGADPRSMDEDRMGPYSVCKQLAPGGHGAVLLALTVCHYLRPARLHRREAMRWRPRAGRALAL